MNPRRTGSENCIDIIRPFRDTLEHEGLLEQVQFMGGIASAALSDERTTINTDDERVSASADLVLPRLRDDGTVRDMDILVLSTDPALIGQIEAIAVDTVGDKLEKSVFGFRPAAYLTNQVKHPHGIKVIKTFVSDRFATASDDSLDPLYKAVYPFSVVMDDDSWKTWTQEVGDLVVPVAAPPASVLNYATRSISGLRPKDSDKIQRAAFNIFSKAPELADWINDGPGKSQKELARVLHSLREPESPGHARRLIIGNAVELVPTPYHELLNHPSFMASGLSEQTQRYVLGLARVKARLLHKAESNHKLVSFYQRHIEQLLDGITKNK